MSSSQSTSSHSNQTFGTLPSSANSWVSARRGVLVHCDDGCNGAPTMALLLLLKYGNCTLREAYARLLAVRPSSDPLPSYRRMLLRAEAHKLGGRRGSSSHGDNGADDSPSALSVRPEELFAMHISELKVVNGSVVAVPHSVRSSPLDLQTPSPSWEMFGISLDSEISLGNDIAAAAGNTATIAAERTSTLITSSVVPAANLAVNTTSWALGSAVIGAAAVVHAAESAAVEAAETLSTTALIATTESEVKPPARSTLQRAAKATSPPMDYYGIDASDESSNSDDDEDENGDSRNDFHDSSSAAYPVRSDAGASEQHLNDNASTSSSLAWESYSGLSAFDYLGSGFNFIDKTSSPPDVNGKRGTLPLDYEVLQAARRKSINALVSEMGHAGAPVLLANHHAHDFLLDSKVK